MKKIRYFIALGQDKEIMDTTARHIATAEVGILCAYPYHIIHDLNDYALSHTKLFADCGAFSTKFFPKIFTDFKIDGLANYINDNPFDVAAELDHWFPDHYVRAKFAGLHAKVLSQKINKSACSIARPLHGENCNERLEYLDVVEAVSGFGRDHYALGGINKKETREPIIETLLALGARGAKRVHLFGVSDNESFAMACDVLRKTTIEEISMDSSSSEKSATHGTVKMYTSSPNPMLYDGHYKIKYQSSPDNKFLSALNGCRCPACLNSVFVGRELYDESIHDLGMQMISGNTFARSMFSKKVQIHNAYQFRLLIEELQKSV